MKIKVKTPAKINLSLEILRKREDGFHDIESIMQAVSLYDYLDIGVKEAENSQNIIKLSGNSDLIPYDKTNLIYKAAELFLKKADLNGKKITIFVEKNIPVAAGLAGGSSDAAGTLYGLNKVFNDILEVSQIHEIASLLGSDINFCFEGATHITSSRGEILEKITTPDLNIAIIKPKNMFISAKEAYTKYSNLPKKPDIIGIDKMKQAISLNNSDKISELLNNHIEKAIFDDYPEIQKIKNYLIKKGCKNALMSGSGPSVFGICDDKIDFADAQKNWECFNVKTISCGALSI